MRLPNGVSTQTRQSPISSRVRSMTMVAVIWHYGGSNFLVSEKADEVFRRHGIQVVLAG